ncbi:unnamed protein product [Porites evermanni]|uniref:C3/C5 convertase n=1 Tax=Porites evermanni TaxID=104178 RepID=A0ABN8LNI6_9CNID|nr:unnamed protein product [Porites evermanni]
MDFSPLLLVQALLIMGVFIDIVDAVPAAQNCTSAPCQHSARCLDNKNTSGFTCVCSSGYSGQRCEIAINQCASNPCQNGATCIDSVNNVTCTCAKGFTGAFCERTRRRRCGDPPSIANGYVKRSKTLALYSCNKGYRAIGFLFIKCSRGRWIGRTPSCLLPAKPGPSCGRPRRIRHGRFTPDRDRFDVGTTVRYICKDKYRLRGVDQLTCGTNLKWKPRRLPSCTEKIKCPDPGIPDNGQRSGSLFYEGTQVRFSCDDGFELDGLRSLECVRLCYSCSSVRWNGTTPTCRRIDPLRGLQRVAESLRRHFIDKLSWSTSDSFARSGLSSGAEGLDLVFVFDSSASVGKANFKKGIAFAKTIIDEFGISSSPSGTRVAVVIFSSTARVVFNLQTNAMPNKDRAIEVLENLDFIAGGTATSIALNKTIEEIVPETRNNSKKALFLITDGRSNIGGDPVADAMILRDSEDFEIYAIGVTNSVDEQELRGIASEPFRTHVHLLENFEDLTKLKELITAKGSDYSACGVAGDTQLRNDERGGSRIVGKSKAKPGAWPWTVAVYVKSKFRCGGVLIKRNWVLTLARCFLNHANIVPKDVVIKVGEHDRKREEGTEQNVRAKKLVIYPNASMTGLEDDLALVRLREDVKLSPFVRTACLPQSGDDFYVRTGKLSVIAGWGSSQEVPSDVGGAPLQVLQQTQIKFASLRDCRKNATNPAAITERVVCAGNSTGDRNACKGDRGSPLMIRRLDNRDSWAVVGLASWSQGCATKGKYGVYTRVDKYIRWIKRKINRRNKKD